MIEPVIPVPQFQQSNDEHGERGPTRAHFVTLDGLRGVAAFVVLLFHRRFWVSPMAFGHGYLAVDFFFLLSGFVIAYAYEDRLASGRMTFAGFLRARIIRLGPLVILGALMGAAVQVVTAARGGTGVGGALAALPFAMATLPVPWSDKPFFINDPSWSLFFEIAANLAFALIAPRLGNRLLAIALITAMIALALVVAGTNSGSMGDGFNHIGLTWPTMLPGIARVAAPFLAGIALHRLWAAGKLPRLKVPFWALALAVFILLCIPPLSPGAEVAYILTCCLIAFPLIIISGCQSPPSPRLVGIASLSAMISFPLYILQMPILQAFDLVRGDVPAHTRVSLIVEAAVICLFSLVVARYFDAPVRRWLGKAPAKPRVVGTGSELARTSDNQF
ncbi:MAG: acyltransferase [Novosphingobium sp.]